MTQYSWSFALSELERKTLDEVLSAYLAHCERELASGAQKPFWALRDDVKRLRAKLDQGRPHVARGVQ